MSDPVTRPNAALEGRYVIERELGEGGMASICAEADPVGQLGAPLGPARTMPYSQALRLSVILILAACGDSPNEPTDGDHGEEIPVDWAEVTLAGGGFFDFACGLAESGSAYCWGDNTYGQLGNDQVSASGVPRGCVGRTHPTRYRYGHAAHVWSGPFRTGLLLGSFEHRGVQLELWAKDSALGSGRHHIRVDHCLELHDLWVDCRRFGLLLVGCGRLAGACAGRSSFLEPFHGGPFQVRGHPGRRGDVLGPKRPLSTRRRDT